MALKILVEMVVDTNIHNIMGSMRSFRELHNLGDDKAAKRDLLVINRRLIAQIC